MLRNVGKKAIIMTGQKSAVLCGAQKDVTDALEQLGISYLVFNKVENNPTLETVTEAAELAKKEGCDFVIGIGGGSPIDAAKAVAVLAANTMAPMDLFKNEFTKALPILAVPTTAGTGSEATPYSVLVIKEKQTKMSFGNKLTYPQYAFLDYRYTLSLEREFTVNTAVDAFSHLFESYLSNRSTIHSAMIALEGLKIFGECLPSLTKNAFPAEVREKLMYVSLLGGICIAQTGVTVVHGMGYCYTFFNNIPHGKANGFLISPYMDYIYPAAKEKINQAMEVMGLRDKTELARILLELLGKPPILTETDIQKYTGLTLLQKGSIANTALVPKEADIASLWRGAAVQI